MVVLAVALASVVLGSILIVLIARYAPARGEPPDERAEDARPALSGRQLDELVYELIAALGLEPVAAATRACVTELTLRDPKPLGGGCLLLRASTAAPDPQQIGLLGEAVRATDEALKGIVICPAGYAAQARAAAAGAVAPVELWDGPQLQGLCARLLGPERAAQLSAYQGFAAPAPPTLAEPPAVRTLERRAGGGGREDYDGQINV